MGFGFDWYLLSEIFSQLLKGCQSEPVEDIVLGALRQAQCDKLPRIGCKYNNTKFFKIAVNCCLGFIYHTKGLTSSNLRFRIVAGVHAIFRKKLAITSFSCSNTSCLI